MFHLYGIRRDDVDFILETFPIVKRKDIAAHGEYRTKRLILEIYDEMAEAQRTGPRTAPRSMTSSPRCDGPDGIRPTRAAVRSVRSGQLGRPAP